MRIAVPQEVVEGERRVALVPEAAGQLVEEEHEVVVEAGAGRDFHPDEAYEQAGAQLAAGAAETCAGADVVLKVQAPAEEEVDRLPEGRVLVCFLDPGGAEELLERLARRGVTTFSMDAIPRIGRAQSMDALSSMGSIAGYQAVLLAAEAAGRYLPMMTTAAGTTKAARVMVLGVGVAGLQAIATARRLGAEVEAFDIRPEVADQVRSLGATFIADAPAEEPDGDDGDEPPSPGRIEYWVKALLGLPPGLGRRRRDGEARAGGAGDPMAYGTHDVPHPPPARTWWGAVRADASLSSLSAPLDPT